jgi:hypothetical protein
MTGARRLGYALALCAAGALAACSAGSGDKPGSDGHAGSPSAGGAGQDPSSVCGTSAIGAPRLRRLSRDELINTLNDVFPAAQGNWTASLSADAVSTHGFDNDSTLLIVGKQAADELDRTADSVAAAITAAAPLATLLPCSASAPDAACAGEFLSKYGRRLFRRSLTADETTRYLGLFQQVLAAKDFGAGIRYLTRALIQSPHAIYRREVGSASGQGYQLSQHELATELAYDFSGTTPSEELLAQADAAQLATPVAREAAARALLQTDAGLRTVEKFFNAWLGYGRASSVTKPGVPEFEVLRDQMVAETRYFIGNVVITRNAGLSELLTTPDTTPSAALASFYGFPAPGSDYAVTQRPAGRGIGILAQGSLLATLSAPNGSSPTKRGLLVMERLLCREKPLVPPDVPVLGEPQPGQLTTRQRYEQAHSQTGSCKACHQTFDPIGFGFEHFDEAGRYRELDGGLPIDSASYVPLDGGELFRFANLEELASGLAAQKLPYECASGFVSTYVFGAAESCLGETKRGAFIDQQLGFIDYIASLAAEPHFAERRLP